MNNRVKFCMDDRDRCGAIYHNEDNHGYHVNTFDHDRVIELLRVALRDWPLDIRYGDCECVLVEAMQREIDQYKKEQEVFYQNVYVLFIKRRDDSMSEWTSEQSDWWVTVPIYTKDPVGKLAELAEEMVQGNVIFEKVRKVPLEEAMLYYHLGD